MNWARHIESSLLGCQLLISPPQLYCTCSGHLTHQNFYIKSSVLVYIHHSCT